MENSTAFEGQGFSISTDNQKLSVTLIHRFLSEESYWAKNIPLAVVQRSINHSLCFGLYHQGEQIGFARLITDKATFAYLADVFILPDYRGKGLSKWLLQNIHTHPELQGLRRWLLGTKDAHSLYAQFGWKAIPEELAARFMQVYYPDVYQKERNGK
jgi:GNAT superfamily N-acetyltransferase